MTPIAIITKPNTNEIIILFFHYGASSRLRSDAGCIPNNYASIITIEAKMARVEGVEPSLTGLEAVVLPLHYTDSFFFYSSNKSCISIFITIVIYKIITFI